MVKPDVLTCWPRDHDYPLWRVQVARDRARFANVIVTFTDDNLGHDLRPFVRDVLPDVTFAEGGNPGSGESWYHRAVTEGLRHSTAEWVWFTEQDFLYDEAFLGGLLTGADDYDAVYVDRDDALQYATEITGRPDPGCFLVRRETLERTSRYFGNDRVSPYVYEYDLFDVFSREVQQLGNYSTTQKLGLTGWTHLNALTVNHYLVANGRWTEIYQPTAFRAYLRDCLTCGVELDPRWRATAEAYLC